MVSVNWNATVKHGLRLASGSLKIRAMSLPTSARRPASERPSRSRPSKLMRLARTRPGKSTSPINASAVTLLPEPDSDFAGLHRQIDIVDGDKRLRDAAEFHGEPFDFEQRHQRLSFGSSASRKPSPIRLNASTVIRIASPGKVTTHDARWMNSSAPASIDPHSGVGGCAPRPRNPSAAASRIALEKPSVAWTISGATQLGRMVANMSRIAPAPAIRDEATYSLPASASTAARARRAE